jgi:hypothetical protein
MIVILLLWLVTLVPIMWNFAGLMVLLAKVRGREASDLVRALYGELRPFYWPAVAVWAGLHVWAGSPLAMVGGTTVMWALGWFAGRGDDDDRWKRRRRKLGDRIRATAAGLKVVPAGAP